jgi:hypothetical protein
MNVFIAAESTEFKKFMAESYYCYKEYLLYKTNKLID